MHPLKKTMRYGWNTGHFGFCLSYCFQSNLFSYILYSIIFMQKLAYYLSPLNTTILCVFPELLMVQPRPPQSPRHQPLTTIFHSQQPLTPDGALPSSPHYSPYSPQGSSPGNEGGGGGGEGGGGGALLQLLSGGPSPLPSPRCLSYSLRFNSDPDTAPSPPCSQQYILWVSHVCLTLHMSTYWSFCLLV